MLTGLRVATPKMLTFPAKTKGSEAGYTLLELLVVVAIISLVVSTAPAIYSRLVPSYQVRQFSNELVVFTRTLREKARVSGKVEALVFDPDNKAIMEGMGAPLPPVSLEVSYEAEPAFGEVDNEVLSFYPNGASNGGIITVSRESLTVRVKIDWVSGAVRVE